MSKSSKKSFSLSAPTSERFLPYPYTPSPACQLPREKSQPWSYTKFITLYVNEILKQSSVGLTQKWPLLHGDYYTVFLQEAKAFSPRFRDCQNLQVADTSLPLLFLGWAAKIKSDRDPRGLRIFSITWSTTKLSFSGLWFLSEQQGVQWATMFTQNSGYFHRQGWEWNNMIDNNTNMA